MVQPSHLTPTPKLATPTVGFADDTRARSRLLEYISGERDAASNRGAMRIRWLRATIATALLALPILLSGCGLVDFVTPGKPPFVRILDPTYSKVTTDEATYTVILAYDSWHFETCSVVNIGSMAADTEVTITHESGVRGFVVPLSRANNYVGAYCTMPNGAMVRSQDNYKNVVRE